MKKLMLFAILLFTSVCLQAQAPQDLEPNTKFLQQISNQDLESFAQILEQLPEEDLKVLERGNEANCLTFCCLMNNEQNSKIGKFLQLFCGCCGLFPLLIKCLNLHCNNCCNDLGQYCDDNCCNDC